MDKKVVDNVAQWAYNEYRKRKEETERSETMTKVYGLDIIAEMVEDKNRIEKAEKEIKKQTVNRMISEGVDKEIAKVMTNVFAEYGL